MPAFASLCSPTLDTAQYIIAALPPPPAPIGYQQKHLARKNAACRNMIPRYIVVFVCGVSSAIAVDAWTSVAASGWRRDVVLSEGHAAKTARRYV